MISSAVIWPPLVASASNTSRRCGVTRRPRCRKRAISSSRLVGTGGCVAIPEALPGYPCLVSLVAVRQRRGACERYCSQHTTPRQSTSDTTMLSPPAGIDFSFYTTLSSQGCYEWLVWQLLLPDSVKRGPSPGLCKGAANAASRHCGYNVMGNMSIIARRATVAGETRARHGEDRIR